MGLASAKQIAKYQTAFVGLAGFQAAGGSSDTITAALTTALSSLAADGSSMPLQAGTPTSEGVDTAIGFNLARIFATATGKVLTDGNGNDVYGKVSVSGSTWTLSYYSMVAGTETAFAMPAATAIDFDVPYIFRFVNLPLRAGTSVTERHVGPDAAAFGFRMMAEPLTVTSTNTLSSLSKAYSGVIAIFFVNGLAVTDKDASPAIAIQTGSKVPSWSAANAGYPLATTDTVTAFYTF